MNCPTCNIQLLMMERLGTQIDYCPQCRGIWLEKGKLDKIIEQAAGSAIPPRTVSEGHNPFRYRYDHESGSQDKHHDRCHDGHDHGDRKKRGFLHDLFD